VILMCTPDNYFQRFIVNGQRFKHYKSEWLRRLDAYYNLRQKIKVWHLCNTMYKLLNYMNNMAKKLPHFKSLFLNTFCSKCGTCGRSVEARTVGI